MPLNVGFYSDALTSGHYGLGRYAWQLLRELGRLDDEVRVRPISARVTLPPAELRALQEQHGYQRCPLPRPLTAALGSSVGLPRLEQWAPWAEIVHCVELDYRVATTKPLVVTIHDIGPLTHPQYFAASHPWLLKIALKSAAKRADAIICVSQATADSVENYLKCRLGDRLAVIPEGVSDEFAQPVDASRLAKTGTLMQSGEPFFLWAGSLNPRKNLPRVIQAFERAAGEFPHHLVLTGGIGWDSDEILRSIRESPLGNRIHLPGRVSDEELRGLYQRAAGFVYASLMEGFGLPILEAMTAGCPVITSNCSSMPEVAGDAASLVNPLDVDAIAGAMRRLATDASFAHSLMEKGHARANGFRWDTCAASMIDIYQRVKRSRPVGRPIATREGTAESQGLVGQGSRPKALY